MTVWAYYRVSTDKQDYESQRFGVLEYAKHKNLTIDREIIDDGVSGTKQARKRKLGIILNEMKSGDIVITSELSRLGRSAVDVILTCDTFVKQGVSCYLVKQGMAIDGSPTGKLMTTIFSAFAEMERDLIALRTKEALQKLKSMGKKLGREKGLKNKTHIMDGKEIEFLAMLVCEMSMVEISKKLNISTRHLLRYQKEHHFPFTHRQVQRFINTEPKGLNNDRTRKE